MSGISTLEQLDKVAIVAENDVYRGALPFHLP